MEEERISIDTWIYSRFQQKCEYACLRTKTQVVGIQLFLFGQFLKGGGDLQERDGLVVRDGVRRGCRGHDFRVCPTTAASVSSAVRPLAVCMYEFLARFLLRFRQPRHHDFYVLPFSAEEASAPHADERIAASTSPFTASQYSTALQYILLRQPMQPPPLPRQTTMRAPTADADKTANGAADGAHIELLQADRRAKSDRQAVHARAEKHSVSSSSSSSSHGSDEFMSMPVIIAACVMFWVVCFGAWWMSAQSHAQIDAAYSSFTDKFVTTLYFATFEVRAVPAFF